MAEFELPPRPWTIDPDTRPTMEWNNWIVSDDGNTVCFMAHNPHDNDALENAVHLMAAAPDLLEALETCLEFIGSKYKDRYRPAGEAMGNARAAIAKAKRQPT